MTWFCVVKPSHWMRLPPPTILHLLLAAIHPKGKSMFLRHHNPVQWSQAMGYARQACARIFRDGGTPADALAAFGLPPTEALADWNIAVERIAQVLCAPRLSAAA